MRVFRPASSAELAEWVRESADRFADEGMPIVTGQRLEAGTASFRARDLPRLGVSTCELSEVVELRPADLTITVQAGMRLSSLEKIVDEAGLWLPLAGAPRDLSVGGWIASAPAGEYDDSFGPLRRHVLACDLLLWTGTSTRWGRAVMKNVAGYDVVKLICGSRARLGLVTQATLRLWPRPRSWRRFRLEREPVSDRPLDLGGLPRCEGLRLRGPARGDGPVGLSVTVAGGAESVSGRAEAVGRWADEQGWAVAEEESAGPDTAFAGHAPEARSGDGAAYRITFGRRYLVPGLRDLERRVGREAEPWSVEAYPGVGVVRLYTESQKAAGERYAPAWLTTLPEAAGGSSAPEPSLDRVVVRVERGGAAEHEASRRLRSTGVREIESRCVAAFRGLEAPWQADYL